MRRMGTAIDESIFNLWPLSECTAERGGHMMWKDDADWLGRTVYKEIDACRESSSTTFEGP